jgi:hypothetical protein
MSDNLLQEFIRDGADVTATDSELAAISTLASKQLELELEVENLEKKLDIAKEELKRVQEFLLPEAMASVGMSEFRLTNGNKITIRDDIYASIRADHVDQAMMWLTDKGLGGIIKDEVKVNFGRGESEKAAKLLELCKAHGFQASEKLAVHPQTLKATVKEQMARGIAFPEEFFSIAPIRKAVIKIR